jgi:hypothetical protein
VREHGFARTPTSATVRDRCTDRGERVSRAAVNFILTGLAYTGHTPRPEDEARSLAARFADQVETLCSNARLDLSGQEIATLRTWIAPDEPSQPETPRTEPDEQP